MTVVRISNLPAQVTYEDLHELVSLVDEPQSLKMEYAADGTRTCEVCCLYHLEFRQDSTSPDKTLPCPCM